MVALKKVSSPFNSASKALLTNGYHPIPTRPDSKSPGAITFGKWTNMTDWPRFRDAAPTPTHLSFWNRWEDANVGIVLGNAVKGTDLVVIAFDFDTDDEIMIDMMQSAIPPALVRKRGRRGFTSFYLAPAETRGRKFYKGSDVIFEILTGQAPRQTILPPSIHIDTKEPYIWLSDPTLENTEAKDLPKLTEDDIDKLIDTVESFEGVEESRAPERTARESSIAGTAPHRALNNLALDRLDDWVPILPLDRLQKNGNGYRSVASYRASSSNRATKNRNRSLSINRDGIVDFGTDQKFTPLNLVMEVTGFDLSGAYEWLSKQLDFGEDEIDLEIPPHDPETGEIYVDEAPISEFQDIEIPAPPVDFEEGIPDDEMPANLARPGGLLERVIDWIQNTDRFPNRTLATAAAITVLGTLMGRHVGGPTNSGTHLFAVGIAPTAAGKNHPMACVGKLLEAARAEDLIGPGDFVSMSGLVNTLKRTPCCVACIDEFGSFLEKMADTRASVHEKQINSTLRKIWGCSFEAFMTPEYAGKPTEKIHSPALSILGMTTPDEFYGSLKEKDISNGFLNRLTVFSTKLKAPQRKPITDPRKVPVDLAESLCQFRHKATTLSSIPDFVKTNSIDNLPARNLEPKLIGWEDPAIEEDLLAFANRIQDIQEKKKGVFALYGRTAEMAIRLATIKAFSDSFRMTVSEEDLKWGIQLASWCSKTITRLASENVAPNEFSQHQMNIANWMRSLSEKEVTSRDIQRKFNSRWKTKELKDLLETMILSGTIIEIKPKIEKGNLHSGGHKVSKYKLAPSVAWDI